MKRRKPAVMAALSFALNYWRRRIFRENRERMAGINAAVQDSLGGFCRVSVKLMSCSTGAMKMPTYRA